MLRGLMTSGVARRTASGGRGGDAFVMSGSSSALRAPNSGRSAVGRDSGPPVTRSRSSVAPRDGSNCVGRHRGIEQRQIVKRIDVPHTLLADGQLREIDRREQREVISAIAASFDRLEPQIAALGTLHGRGGGPFAGTTAGGRCAGSASDALSTMICRWMSARRRSASSFCGSVGRTRSRDVSASRR